MKLFIVWQGYGIFKEGVGDGVDWVGINEWRKRVG